MRAFSAKPATMILARRREMIHDQRFYTGQSGYFIPRKGDQSLLVS